MAIHPCLVRKSHTGHGGKFVGAADAIAFVAVVVVAFVLVDEELCPYTLATIKRPSHLPRFIQSITIAKDDVFVAKKE